MARTIEEVAKYLNPAFEAAFPEIAAFCVYEAKQGTFLCEVFPVTGKGFGMMITTQTKKELILMQIGIIHQVLDNAPVAR